MHKHIEFCRTNSLDQKSNYTTLLRYLPENYMGYDDDNGTIRRVLTSSIISDENPTMKSASGKKLFAKNCNFSMSLVISLSIWSRVHTIDIVVDKCMEYCCL